MEICACAVWNIKKCAGYGKGMVIYMKSKMVRRILASAIAFAMVLGTAACGNGGDAGGKAETGAKAGSNEEAASTETAEIG